MTVSHFQPFPLHQLPLNVIYDIGLLLSARGFASLLQVSNNFYRVISIVRAQIARNERIQMRIRSEVVPLNAWQTAEQWGQLPSEDSNMVRIAFTVSPLMFYAGVIDPAMVVLREPFLTVRNNPAALAELALGHLDLRQAAILASRISNQVLRALTLHAIVENAINEYLPENEDTILQLIARFLPVSEATTILLRQLLLTADMPLKKIKEILEWIPIPRERRDEILRDLARKNGTEISKAIDIACLIEDRKERDETLRHIALRDDIAPKGVLRILTLLMYDLKDPLDHELLKELKKKDYFKNNDFSLDKIFNVNTPLSKEI
jgi:hypothetical protein